eukprot:1885113-Ditylum_brightwellii.AAC.1
MRPKCILHVLKIPTGFPGAINHHSTVKSSIFFHPPFYHSYFSPAVQPTNISAELVSYTDPTLHSLHAYLVTDITSERNFFMEQTAICFKIGGERRV